MVDAGFAVAATFIGLLSQVSEHGMMWNPPGRSSMWRFGFDVPINYNDNELFCGGFQVQWHQNDGKCGICGDAYNAVRPRENEHGGKYGTGTIAETYKEGSVIPVTIRLTAEHLGHFEYHVCNLDGGVSETEDCFRLIRLADGSVRFNVSSGAMDYKMGVRLPSGLACEHCVLRWHYRGGNRWGECEDGSHALGCGPQETFRSCSDIRIVR